MARPSFSVHGGRIGQEWERLSPSVYGHEAESEHDRSRLTIFGCRFRKKWINESADGADVSRGSNP